MKMDNKLYLICFLLWSILALPNASYAINADNIAVIDYYLAFCLHPQMALYDYNRAGFYKVDFGFSDIEFESAVDDLLRNPPKFLVSEKERIEKRLAEIQEKKRNELDNEAYDRLYNEEETLKKTYEDVLWKYNNNDITDQKETGLVFQKIINDIDTAIEEVYNENDFAIVLNSSFAYPYPDIPSKTESIMQGYSMPGLNSIFFYGLYNKKDVVTDTMKKSYENIGDLYWDELTNSSDMTKNEYELFPYPVILSGGNSITSSVVKRIYHKYNINLSTQELLNSVIMKVEALNNGRKLVFDRKEIIQENNK